MQAAPNIDREPLVTVILPTRNRAPLLRHAIHSVLAQTYGRLELLVIDDASTDDTPQVVEAIHDPRLRYIRLVENRRAAHARNLGIREGRGSLVAFNDDDDLWLVEKLEKQVEHLRSSPLEVGLSIGGHIRQWEHRSDYVGGDRYFGQLDFTHGFLDELDVSLAATPGWVVRREVLERVGGFDERMRCWDDWELASRLSQVCRFAHLNEPLFLQERRRLASGGMWDDLPNFVNDYTVIIEKHAGRWSRSDRSKNLRQVARAIQAAGDVAAARPWLERAVRANPFNFGATGDLIRALLARAISPGKRSGRRPSTRAVWVETVAPPVDAPLVSVIVLGHARTETLARAVTSVLRQSWRNLEVIIVSDDATDHTAELVGGWQDPRLRYVRVKPFAKPAAAYNTGLRAARGEFVAFQNQDGEWVSGRLEQQMGVFAKSGPGVVLVAGMLQRYDEVEHRSVAHYWNGSDATRPSSDVDRRGFIDGLAAFMETTVVRRAATERAGHFDETLPVMEGFELCLRLLDYGEFRALSAVVSVSHHRQDAVPEHLSRRSRAMRAIFDKYAALFEGSGEAPFRDWYGLAHRFLATGTPAASAHAAREAARYKPRDPRPWIFWALMSTVPALGPWTVRIVRRARALFGV